MLRSLFLRGAKTARTRASLPEGDRIYAIGDVHGRLDLLEDLLAAIGADDAARGPARTQIIFLGDLIDRGPQSAQVVERALTLSRKTPNHRFLLGNHEEVFLKSLGGDLKALAFFIRIGGRETILSYGISEEAYQRSDYPELLEQLRAAVPTEHTDFLQTFEHMIILGDYAFVHAGINPERTLDNQKLSDLHWIREGFLNARGPFEKTIIHGHSITQDAEILSHRIGIDTGAYVSDRLTSLGLQGENQWLLQTSPSGVVKR